jgi:hypothetical protein
MSNTTPSANLGLPIPTLSDPAPDWQNNVQQCLTGLDTAIGGNSTGIGQAKVDLSKQTTSGDISANGNNFSNSRSVEFQNQSTQLTGSQDVNCLYVLNNILGFNTSAGAFIPLSEEGGAATLPDNYSQIEITADLSILPTATYNWINADTTSGSLTITLPVIASLSNPAGRFYYFNDAAGNFEVSSLTIQASVSSGNTLYFNGNKFSSTATINWQGGAGIVYTDGNNSWYVITFSQNVTAGANVTYNSSTVSFISSSLVMDGMSSLSLPAQITNNNYSSYTPELICPINIEPGPGATNGQINVNVAGGITSNVSGGIQTTVSGGIISNVDQGILTTAFGGIVSTAPGGIIGTAAASITSDVIGGIRAGHVAGIQSDNVSGITTIVLGGLALGAGANDYPTFTNTSGSSAPRTRKFVSALQLYNGALTAGWLVTGSLTISAPATNNPETFVIPITHNGATLSSVIVVLFPTLAHSSLPSNLPTISVFYQTYNSTSRNALSTFSVQTLPSPSDVNAYKSNPQYLEFVCNQNNIIDNTNNMYFLQITDESGTNSVAGNQYYSVTLNYTNILDMRFSI